MNEELDERKKSWKGKMKSGRWRMKSGNERMKNAKETSRKNMHTYRMKHLEKNWILMLGGKGFFELTNCALQH